MVAKDNFVELKKSATESKQQTTSRGQEGQTQRNANLGSRFEVLADLLAMEMDKDDEGADSDGDEDGEEMVMETPT